jgi:thioredoxin reductase (NADPH)
MKAEQVIVVGSGPAGLTAAVYAARACREPLVLTGPALGGQIATTIEVENYPGFPEGVTGADLTTAMQQQAERFGARLEMDEVVQVDLKRRPFEVKTAAAEYQAQALIVASGASPRKLGVPGEARLTGRGVSYCATCDGFFFRDKHVIVVGGGDSALQESLFLTRFAETVTIVHRRDRLRAGVTLTRRAAQNSQIRYRWNSVVTRIEGDGRVDSVVLTNVHTGEETIEPVDGVFIYIGHLPNTRLFQGQLAMDADGYLRVDAWLHTDVEGVFAAGEVHDRRFRQAIVSAGYGCMAALEAEKYLGSLDDALR